MGLDSIDVEFLRIWMDLDQTWQMCGSQEKVSLKMFAGTASGVPVKGAEKRPFYSRDAMLARVFATATCLSVCPSVCLSYAGIVPSRAKAGS